MAWSHAEKEALQRYPTHPIRLERRPGLFRQGIQTKVDPESSGCILGRLEPREETGDVESAQRKSSFACSTFTTLMQSTFGTLVTLTPRARERLRPEGVHARRTPKLPERDTAIQFSRSCR